MYAIRDEMEAMRRSSEEPVLNITQMHYRSAGTHLDDLHIDEARALLSPAPDEQKVADILGMWCDHHSDDIAALILLLPRAPWRVTVNLPEATHRKMLDLHRELREEMERTGIREDQII